MGRPASVAVVVVVVVLAIVTLLVQARPSRSDNSDSAGGASRWISTTVVKFRSGRRNASWTESGRRVLLRTEHIVQAVASNDSTIELMMLAPSSDGPTVYAVSASTTALCAALGCRELVDSAEYALAESAHTMRRELAAPEEQQWLSWCDTDESGLVSCDEARDRACGIPIPVPLGHPAHGVMLEDCARQPEKEDENQC